MKFLKFINMEPKCFNNILDTTSDVEVLAMIGKLLVDMNVNFQNGIPKYGHKDITTAQCMGAKLEMLTALLNEYQVRKQLVERCEPCYNLPPVAVQVLASKSGKSKKKVKKALAKVKAKLATGETPSDKDNDALKAMLNALDNLQVIKLEKELFELDWNSDDPTIKGKISEIGRLLETFKRRVQGTHSRIKAKTKALANKVKITDENYMDYAQALHWYCTENYDGMGDPLYEISCKLKYTPGATERGVSQDNIHLYDEISSLSTDEMEQMVKDIHSIQED